MKTDESRTRKLPTKSPDYDLPFDCLLCGSASSLTENAGMATCVVEIYQCLPFTEEFEDTVCCEVYPGFVYRTRNLRWLSRKFPVKGQLGFFTIDLPSDVTLFTPTVEQLHQKRQVLLANEKLV